MLTTPLIPLGKIKTELSLPLPLTSKGETTVGLPSLRVLIGSALLSVQYFVSQ